MIKLIRSIKRKVRGFFFNTPESMLFWTAINEIVKGNLDLSQEETYMALMKHNYNYVTDQFNTQFDTLYECSSEDYEKGGKRLFFKPYQVSEYFIKATLFYPEVVFTEEGFITASSSVIYVKNYLLGNTYVNLPIVYTSFGGIETSRGGIFQVIYDNEIVSIKHGWSRSLKEDN